MLQLMNNSEPISQNYKTNTRHVCTYLNAFIMMVNPHGNEMTTFGHLFLQFVGNCCRHVVCTRQPH